MNKKDLILNLEKIIGPVVDQLGYELYHIEFVKESDEYFLRVYIDKEQGISLQDCEKVSRSISDILDAEDPIDDPYYLEVSSPGIERILYNDKHLEKSMDKDIIIKLIKKFNGSKQYEGKLRRFDSKYVVIESNDLESNIPREFIKSISLRGDF